MLKIFMLFSPSFNTFLTIVLVFLFFLLKCFKKQHTSKVLSKLTSEVVHGIKLVVLHQTFLHWVVLNFSIIFKKVFPQVFL